MTPVFFKVLRHYSGLARGAGDDTIAHRLQPSASTRWAGRSAGTGWFPLFWLLARLAQSPAVCMADDLITGGQQITGPSQAGVNDSFPLWVTAGRISGRMVDVYWFPWPLTAVVSMDGSTSHR